jgi:hypothetical protein
VVVTGAAVVLGDAVVAVDVEPVDGAAVVNGGAVVDTVGASSSPVHAAAMTAKTASAARTEERPRYDTGTSVRVAATYQHRR